VGNLLDILIPTFNRADYLRKNLEMLGKYIVSLEEENNVYIIVSNNASTDHTSKVVEEFRNNFGQIHLKYFEQEVNLGLEKNAVSVFSKSTAKYSMFLGDDDYIDKKYLEKILYHMRNDDEISCFIPSFQSIDLNGNDNHGRGRDLNKPTKRYKRGEISAALNMYKGHQLSGVTVLRDKTLNEYLTAQCRNIYPFMFFVGFNCKRGDCLHITDFPVRVTNPPQSHKDWNYGKDGLNIERYKNSYGLFRNSVFARFLAEYKLIKINNRGFFFRYLQQGLAPASFYVFRNLRTPYLSLLGKIYFVSLTFFDLFTKPIRKPLRPVKRFFKEKFLHE
jgi:glycosyltransferase involved in cell wall biosynthesis